jgi:hypothetical protein
MTLDDHNDESVTTTMNLRTSIFTGIRMQPPAPYDRAVGGFETAQTDHSNDSLSTGFSKNSTIRRRRQEHNINNHGCSYPSCARPLVPELSEAEPLGPRDVTLVL